MTLTLMNRGMVLVLSLVLGLCAVFAYAATAHASLAGDINCEVGDILDQHNLPGPSGCDDDEEPTPTDLCPNDAGVQTATPCASDDVCPNDSGIQTSTPCPSDNTDGNTGGGNNGGGSPSPSGSIDASGQTEPNGGGIAPGSSAATGGGGGGAVLGTTTAATSTVATSTPTIPEILSVNMCAGEPLLKTYMRIGKNNDIDEVKKLQTFLNLHLDLSLSVTGFFDQQTHAAVNTFQVKHAAEVLRPWVVHGLPSETTPTGYVYKTTQRMINNLACEMNLPVPQLP